MMTLATRNCSLNPNVRVVCLDFEGDKDSNKDLIQHGLGCVEGNHSVIAAQRLHAKYKNNARFATIKVELYLASAKSTEDRSMLRIMGSISNVKTQKGWDFEQILHYMHSFWYAECKLRGWDPLELESANRSEIVDQIVFSTSTPKNLVDLYWTLINRSEAVWTRVSQLVRGQCAFRQDHKVKKFKTVTNFSAFNKCSKIPDRALCEIFDKALHGYIETKDINLECIKYRKRILMEEHVLSMVQSSQDLRKGEAAFRTYDEVVSHYHTVDWDRLFDLYLPTYLNQSIKDKRVVVPFQDQVLKLVGYAKKKELAVPY